MWSFWCKVKGFWVRASDWCFHFSSLTPTHNASSMIASISSFNIEKFEYRILPDFYPPIFYCCHTPNKCDSIFGGGFPPYWFFFCKVISLVFIETPFVIVILILVIYNLIKLCNYNISRIVKNIFKKIIISKPETQSMDIDVQSHIRVAY